MNTQLQEMDDNLKLIDIVLTKTKERILRRDLELAQGQSWGVNEPTRAQSHVFPPKNVTEPNGEREGHLPCQNEVTNTLT